MSFEEPSNTADVGFAEYKRSHEGTYSAESLMHHFNTEMGIASNLLNTLRSKLKSGQNSETMSSDIDTIFVTIGEHLTTSHEIGNIMSEMLYRIEQ